MADHSRHFVNTKAIAHMLDCTTTHVARLVKTAGLPVAVRRTGRAGHLYDPRSVMAWKINLELSKQLPDADKSLDGERLRLVMEQADEKAIKNATDRGQLIWASHVRQLFTEAASMMRSSVRGLSGRLANELAGIDDPARCKSLVQSELDATLAGYARSLDQFGEPEASTEVGRTDN